MPAAAFKHTENLPSRPQINLQSANVSSSGVPKSAAKKIPFTYRFLITTLEPLFATVDAFISFSYPSSYVHTLTRGTVGLPTDAEFLGTQLSAAWLCFAFNEAVDLRLVDDIRVWNLLIWGMLISDVCYVHSLAQAMGGWGEFLRMGEWTLEDWVVTVVASLPFMVARLLIVFQAGFKETKQS